MTAPILSKTQLIAQEQVAAWVGGHALLPIHIDCAVTVMLKILDGKCKMRPTEKVVMTLLYDQVKAKTSQILTAEIHQLIALARLNTTDEGLTMLVYEKRLLAETAISRPTMKGFKAMIREQGLFDGINVNDDVDD